jgi:hypothetical protein
MFLVLLLFLALCALWYWNSAAGQTAPRLARVSERDVAALAVMSQSLSQAVTPTTAKESANTSQAANPSDPTDRSGAGADDSSEEKAQLKADGTAADPSDLLPRTISVLVLLSLALFLFALLRGKANSH